MFADRQPRTVTRRLQWWNAVSPLLWPLGQRAAALKCSFTRRLGWFATGLTFQKLSNILRASAHFVLRNERVNSMPIFLRIDVSPLCNLRCTVCIHAHADGNPALRKQQFDGSQQMELAQYRRLIDEVSESACGVSLYYLGDPLVHPEVDEMCGIARRARLNVHYSTNFSFVLSDQRIRDIVSCGLTHLTVCVDGLSQNKYERTRVGGRIDLVLSNLRRVCACRESLRGKVPLIEVQYIKYQHNLDELDAARRLFSELGVDQVHELWGGLHNYTDRDPGNYTVVGPKKKSWVPHCHWPHFFMQIKYNGDVIPCCCFRLGQQYSNTDAPRCVGNVFETSVREVWNSAQYRDVRRIISRPGLTSSTPSLKKNFCYACPRLFNTDYAEKTCRFGDKYSFEDLYETDERGRPFRRKAVSVERSRDSEPSVAPLRAPRGA